MNVISDEKNCSTWFDGSHMAADFFLPVKRINYNIVRIFSPHERNVCQEWCCVWFWFTACRCRRHFSLLGWYLCYEAVAFHMWRPASIDPMSCFLISLLSSSTTHRSNIQHRKFMRPCEIEWIMNEALSECRPAAVVEVVGGRKEFRIPNWMCIQTLASHVTLTGCTSFWRRIFVLFVNFYAGRSEKEIAPNTTDYSFRWKLHAAFKFACCANSVRR